MVMNSVSAPSRWTPRVSLNAQALGRPRRQEAHLPQFVYGDMVTFTPAASAGNEELPSTIVAAISWPGIRGNWTMGFLPRNEFKSLPQRPTIRTRSNTLPCSARGWGTDSMVAVPGSLMMRALIVFEVMRFGSENRPHWRRHQESCPAPRRKAAR